MVCVAGGTLLTNLKEAGKRTKPAQGLLDRKAAVR
jgi:hypothetical protein